MELFSGNESTEDYILVAFGLEQGLREFYLLMQDKTKDDGCRALFARLASIEVLHQERLLALYQQVTGNHKGAEDFSGTIVSPALEGGMSTDDYLARYSPDLNSITDILSLAITIEAQALDLYQRASFRAKDETTRNALQQIADEERVHLQYLADYMETSTK